MTDKRELLISDPPSGPPAVRHNRVGAPGVFTAESAATLFTRENVERMIGEMRVRYEEWRDYTGPLEDQDVLVVPSDQTDLVEDV